MTKVIFKPTLLPSFTFALVCLHVCVSLSLFFSLSLSLTFLIDTKTARRVRQHSRRVVSFRLFRSRRGSVSLCALLIFLPLHRIRLCIYDCVCVCVFASLCVCQLLILYKHTHACALAHTLTHTDDDGKRGTPRRWVEERQRKKDRERERRSPYILAHKMVVMLSARYMTVGGQIYSRISFRSDDDNDDVPSSSISTQLRRYDFSSSIYTIDYLYCCCLFFSYQYNNDYNSYRFLCQYMNVYASPETVKMCHASLQ